MSSVYVMYRSSAASWNVALIEIAFLSAIVACLYFSYQLIVIINKTFS